MRQSIELTHYLIRAIYLPRIIAYLLAALVTASGDLQAGPLELGVPVFLALLIAYPHLAYFFSCRYANSALGAQASLRVDAVLVGMLVVVNQFHFLATVSFVAALVMSILLIAAVRGLWLNLTLLVMTTLVGYWWLSWAGTDRIAAPEPEENLLKTWLSGLFILTYSATAAALGFRVSRHLGQGRKQLAAYQAKIDDLSMRLQRYVSPQIYQGMINDDLEVTRRRCLSVCFADIEGFTALMDRLAEETVTRLLNDYLNAMAGVALEFGGTIDKFMGDGIMIFFGDPTSRGRRGDALACVEMALAMQDNLAELRCRWCAEGIYSDVHSRIGIHTGDCAVGNFGSAQRLDYTAIGSTVNIASRLEGKAARDGILISGETFALVSADLQCQAGTRIKLRGIQRDIDAYQVVGRVTGSVAPGGETY